MAIAARSYRPSCVRAAAATLGTGSRLRRSSAPRAIGWGQEARTWVTAIAHARLAVAEGDAEALQRRRGPDAAERAHHVAAHVGIGVAELALEEGLGAGGVEGAQGGHGPRLLGGGEREEVRDELGDQAVVADGAWGGDCVVALFAIALEPPKQELAGAPEAAPADGGDRAVERSSRVSAARAPRRPVNHSASCSSSPVSRVSLAWPAWPNR